MAPRSFDRPEHTDPDEQRRRAADTEHAAALHVVTRFREQPEVAREVLDMLGLLGSPGSQPLVPGPPPPEHQVRPRRQSR